MQVETIADQAKKSSLRDIEIPQSGGEVLLVSPDILFAKYQDQAFHWMLEMNRYYGLIPDESENLQGDLDTSAWGALLSSQTPSLVLLRLDSENAFAAGAVVSRVTRTNPEGKSYATATFYNLYTSSTYRKSDPDFRPGTEVVGSLAGFSDRIWQRLDLDQDSPLMFEAIEQQPGASHDFRSSWPYWKRRGLPILIEQGWSSSPRHLYKLLESLIWPAEEAGQDVHVELIAGDVTTQLIAVPRFGQVPVSSMERKVVAQTYPSEVWSSVSLGEFGPDLEELASGALLFRGDPAEFWRFSSFLAKIQEETQEQDPHRVSVSESRGVRVALQKPQSPEAMGEQGAA